jgi:sulfur carrier protein ThiS
VALLYSIFIFLTDAGLWYTIGDVKIIYRDKTWELKGGMTARDAIKKIGMEPEAVLVVVNGNLQTDDAILQETDEVKLIAVISGGRL